MKLIASCGPLPSSFRRPLVSGLVLAALACGCAGPESGEAELESSVGRGLAPGANLVLIMIDTLRADHCSLYGYDRPTTPNLEVLAGDSFVFDHCLTNASWTRPSIASFFTGRLPDSHGAVTRKGRIADSEITLAEMLERAGYATVGWFGNPNVHPAFGFGQGFDSYQSYGKREIAPGELPVCTAGALTRQAIAWLEEHAATSDGSPESARPPRHPFFMYLHYMDPHAPYFSHAAHDFDPGYEGKAWGAVSWLKKHRVDAEPDRDHIRALYDGEVAFVDASIGRLLGRIERLGLRRDTVIVVTADHGEGLWSHRTRDHGREVYEEQIHVPLLITLPGHRERGRRVSGLARSTDLLPTLAEVLGLEVPPAVEGRSLVHLATDPEAQQLPVFVREELDGHDLAALRGPRYKVILDLARASVGGSQEDAVECYDLIEDPLEQRPLTVGQWPPGAQKLYQDLLDLLSRSSARTGAEEVGPDSLAPEIEEGLRALGYVE